MPRLLATTLELARCPHCNVDTPHLRFIHQQQLNTKDGVTRNWRLYGCSRCGGIITATAPSWDADITQIFPSGVDVSEDIPTRTRAYLDQSINSLSTPAGAVMLAASAVDSMLKAKGLTDGSLYSRIEAAAKSGLITADMAQWAHDVRLDANDQRHTDDNVSLPTATQAEKCVEFALALAQFLFVLPARVTRGIQNAKGVS